MSVFNLERRRFWLVKSVGGCAVAGVVEEIRLSEETDGGGWHNSSQHRERGEQYESMKVWKIRQYLPALACTEAFGGRAWDCGFCEDARRMRGG
jgi:hypothetical protein